MRRLAGVLLVLAATVPAGRAAEGAGESGAAPPRAAVDAPANVEEFALRLFTLGCVTRVRAPAEVAAFAQQTGMPPIKMPYARMFFEGQRGAAWSASNHWGRFVLALRQDGSCALYARRLNADALAREFEGKLIAGIAETYTVETAGPGRVADGPTVQRWVAGTGQRHERLHLALTRAGAGAPFAAILTARMVRTGTPAAGGGQR